MPRRTPSASIFRRRLGGPTTASPSTDADDQLAHDRRCDVDPESRARNWLAAEYPSRALTKTVRTVRGRACGPIR
jgi:hypothetical protein